MASRKSPAGSQAPAWCVVVEIGHGSRARSQRMTGRTGRAGRPSARYWLLSATAVIVLATLLPPAGTWARRYVFAESLQFAWFAIVVPALVVLAAPWPRALAGRVAAARLARPGFLRAAAYLVVFAGASVAWRSPTAVDALPRHPGLVLLELASLLAAGTGLWLEIAESRPLVPRIARWQRAVMAALAMWTIWALAYILGFSRTAWYPAYRHVAGHGLSVAADQQLATWALWAVAAFSFLPIVFYSAMVWLKDADDPDGELHAVVRRERHRAWASGSPRQPG
jgi:cytochrome c oxidase assembly factor CtaG